MSLRSIFLQLVLLASICIACGELCMKADRTSPRMKNITIGFLSSFNFMNSVGKLIAGALPLAVEAVNNRSDLLPNHTLQYIAAHSGRPDTCEAMRRMSEMKEEGVIAFIGPDNSCASEAKLAAAWSYPMIAYKCTERKVSNKTVFPTFARTLPPSTKVSKSVISLLDHFDWRKIVIVVADNAECLQVKEAIADLAKYKQITVTDTRYVEGDYITKFNATIRKVIDETYRKTRVYVLITDNFATVDFAVHMYRKGLLKNGEYMIISVDQEVYNPNLERQFIDRAIDQEQNAIRIAAYRSVMKITPCHPINPDYHLFEKAVSKKNLDCFNVPYHPDVTVRIHLSAAHVYDAVMIYSRAVTEVLADGGSPLNGTMVFNRIHSRSYESILGVSVWIDENGDAEGNYTVLALKNSAMVPVGKFTRVSNQDFPKFFRYQPIDWIGDGPPRSEPVCGFDGEHCILEMDWQTFSISAGVCVFLIVALGVFASRYVSSLIYERKLASFLWRIYMKDVTVISSGSEPTLQNIKNARRKSIFSQNEVSDTQTEHLIRNRTYTKTGFYKGQIVAIRPVQRKSFDLTRNIRKELKEIRDLRNENINHFVGACIDPPNIAIFTSYCSRGSLEDVLQNEDLDLDNMFISSLIADLIKGMIYLHDSEIISHGNLKSSNCLVDSRWVLQITDFGLWEFKGYSEGRHHNFPPYRRGLLWHAPELLRTSCVEPRGTQKGDVYSFGIILHEVLARKGPWGEHEHSIKDIIDRVMFPSNYGGSIHRPQIYKLDCPDYILKCMCECWDEIPELRPDFRFIRIKLKQMQAGLKPNIIDNMMAMMVKYAYNLEGLVEARTNQLVEEKKKTEALLLRMLPKPVADQLKRGEPVEAESFDSVSIYFSDIVGFTALSAVSTPLQVVELLNDLYTCFDSIIEHYDVYKVETIGDAYMVVSGLPLRNGDRHAAEIASMALHLLKKIKSFRIRHLPGELLKLRIGIHSGPCVAGVVGLKMPRYCLFGDTVNTASRMESTGDAFKIHISEAFKFILDKLGEYTVEERGLTYIKGKGEMRTYWLIDEKTEGGTTKSQAKELIENQPKSHIADDSIRLVTKKYREYSILTPPGSPNVILNDFAKFNMKKQVDIAIPPPPPLTHHRRSASQRRRVSNYYSNSLSILIENSDFQNVQSASPNINSKWHHINERYPSAPIIEFK